MEFFQDCNLKAIKHNLHLYLDNSNKIKHFNLETTLEDLCLIIIKLCLEFLLRTCSAINQLKLNSLRQMMTMMMMVLIKMRRMKLPLLISQIPSLINPKIHLINYLISLLISLSILFLQAVNLQKIKMHLKKQKKVVEMEKFQLK